jgi:hypothetical protein
MPLPTNLDPILSNHPNGVSATDGSNSTNIRLGVTLDIQTTKPTSIDTRHNKRPRTRVRRLVLIAVILIIGAAAAGLTLSPPDYSQVLDPMVEGFLRLLRH